jgi:hypothetical protein
MARNTIGSASLVLALVLAIVFSSAITPALSQDERELKREQCVRDNMESVQLAVESYANDTMGVYPSKLDDALKTYFTGGSLDGMFDVGDRKSKNVAGKPPVNPFTGRSEWPVIGKPVSDVIALRKQTQYYLAPGVIEYCPVFNADGVCHSYVIRAGGANSAVTARPTSQFIAILSNQ